MKIDTSSKIIKFTAAQLRLDDIIREANSSINKIECYKQDLIQAKQLKGTIIDFYA
jgi:hypothetical protein